MWHRARRRSGFATDENSGLAIEMFLRVTLKALIQYENRWFWKTSGSESILGKRAAWLRSGGVSGGSAHKSCMQLLSSAPKTFGGKVRQQLWLACTGVSVYKRESDLIPRVWRRVAGIGAAKLGYPGRSPAEDKLFRSGNARRCCRKRQPAAPGSGRNCAEKPAKDARRYGKMQR